jgi:S1-C subfamily serine protease
MAGQGSGVLISSDGKVLTAAHVVQAADKILVQFGEDKYISAYVIASQLYADVALLQLDRVPPGIEPAQLGNSDSMDIGDDIFVVGAPYGLSNTLAAGHISGRRVSNMHTGSFLAMEFFQTDAAINTGVSGGPMFNMKGEVIGIVSNIMTRSGGFEGIGFVATSKIARQLLIDQKSFWSGVDGLLIEGEMAKILNIPQPAGFYVQRVAEGSPAWRQGLRGGSIRALIEGEEILLGGDIILEINGITLERGYNSYDRIYASMSSLKPGDILRTKILRNGSIFELAAEITSQ